MIRPSKSNARHLIRRACFNLPKLSSISAAHSSASVQQSISPTSQSYSSGESTFSTPFTHRKTNLHDHTIFTTSQSKEAPSRGVSPRIPRNTPANNIYNPSSIERIWIHVCTLYIYMCSSMSSRDIIIISSSFLALSSYLLIYLVYWFF